MDHVRVWTAAQASGRLLGRWRGCSDAAGAGNTGEKDGDADGGAAKDEISDEDEVAGGMGPGGGQERGFEERGFVAAEEEVEEEAEEDDEQSYVGRVAVPAQLACPAPLHTTPVRGPASQAELQLVKECFIKVFISSPGTCRGDGVHA